MRFPNAFRGVKKIWLAELLMLLAAVIGIILIFVIAANSTLVGDDVVVNKEAVETPAAILGILAALIALTAFILNLVGMINARNDDAGFRIALLVTVLGIITSAVRAGGIPLILMPMKVLLVHFEQPGIGAADGEFFRLAVRQADVAGKVRVNVLSV